MSPSSSRNTHEQQELFPEPEPLPVPSVNLEFRSVKIGTIRMSATPMSFELAARVLAEIHRR